LLGTKEVPMRILLVQAHLGRRGLADQLVFPIGLSCVATALAAAGHEPWILDTNVGDPDPERGLRRELERFRPDLVGVSLRNIDSTTRKAPVVFHTRLAQTLETIRAWSSSVPTLLGGPGFTQGARPFMERYPYDLGVVGEGEQTAVALLENLDHPERVPGVLYRRDGEVLYTGEAPRPPFHALPLPRRDLVDWEPYRRAARERGLRLDIGVEASRGCPGRCAYCNYPTLNGCEVRRKPPAVVVDELTRLKERYGVEEISFTDSRFNLSWSHAQAICEEIVARGLRIRWRAWLGLGQITPERLALLRDAGCVQVGFCPDALHQPSLDRLRKGLSPGHIARSIEAVRRTPGIRATWSFFCVPPGTTHAEQLALLRTYATIHGRLRGRGRMMLTWCRVEQGTHFERIAREDGFLRGDEDLLPGDAEQLRRLFHVPSGFEGWSAFWDRFLEIERRAVDTIRRRPPERAHA
jgi:anaerobic magnesium-protoporphyrin IX monomethyl ester cyclase